jgi:hypothetical protein
MKAQLMGAVLLAAALAGCGGKAKFTIGGSVSGLANQGLVLQNNGGSDLTVNAGATSFSFPNSISYGTEYNVTIKTQPDHMTCGVANPTGSAGHTTTISIVISCTQNSYALGGSVVNLQGENLVLVNGSSSGQIAIAKGATSFVLPAPIPVGTAYGLSVLTQPSNPSQTCTVSNGTGVMGDAARANVVVDCRP